ncbi:MAG: ferrous iron transporter B [Candidatus Kapabacteria bacterium]|jgi:ferrous iron transport protein B|nr:ferrous iron transporter B [Candidatus Kapabacteria bacterium]
MLILYMPSPAQSTPDPSPNLTVALVGAPNCGKSTIFNALTGLRQKVGNFPGVTVEPKSGDAHIDKTITRLIDLPGLYSFTPKTPDEALSVAVLSGDHERLPRPDAVVFVMEGTNLEKSLFLYAQFAALNLPTVVVVTMIDSIKASGGVFDDIAMEQALNVPVIGIVGHRGIGLEELREHLALRGFTRPEASQNHVPHDAAIENQHEWARNLASDVARVPETDSLTLNLDALFLHPVLGPLIFLAVMLLFFQSVFTWATPVMDSIDAGFAWLQSIVDTALPAGIVQDFLSRGVIAGVGAVIVFLPQILILTLFITLLEDFGYLARGAFLVDRMMGVFGLQGRSFIPLLSSFACAIPGMMSARIISSEKDRLTTILIAPLMTCSARLPVYVLLITAFVPATLLGGVLSLQGLVLMGLYALGAISGLVVGKVFKSTIFQGSKLPFLMELPPYRFPTWRSVFLTLFHRTKQFLTSAGTTILVLSVIIWALGAFPRTTAQAGASATEAAAVQLEHSVLGTLGKAIEPMFAPIGFDWKITIGVLGSFAAREVFVSVMGQVYSVDVSESDETLRTVLKSAISLPTALSILVFYVYALQCMSTLAVMKRETGSWKYPALAFAYTLVLAYSSSLLVFHLARVW